MGVQPVAAFVSCAVAAVRPHTSTFNAAMNAHLAGYRSCRIAACARLWSTDKLPERVNTPQGIAFINFRHTLVSRRNRVKDDVGRHAEGRAGDTIELLPNNHVIRILEGFVEGM